VKLAAFAAGGVIAGLGGALYAHYTLFIDPEAFGVGRSLFVMLYAVFGGLAASGAYRRRDDPLDLPELLRWVKDWRDLLRAPGADPDAVRRRACSTHPCWRGCRTR
jgi:branched-chain amino acid transport system permease protein